AARAGGGDRAVRAALGERALALPGSAVRAHGGSGERDRRDRRGRGHAAPGAAAAGGRGGQRHDCRGSVRDAAVGRARAAGGARQGAAPEARGAPHPLYMAAAPIPRTHALAEYGDLDTSTLRELPRGRQPIDTRIVSGARGREHAYEELREQLGSGRQAFVVCPLIDDDEAKGEAVRAAVAELERLRAGPLSSFELVLLHGAMNARERQEAMARFANGAAQVLVATTVIEVGIDVPNATVMLIENAERFGLSQLHQLRGRVGRGAHAGMCLLMSDGAGRSARLRALEGHS